MLCTFSFGAKTVYNYGHRCLSRGWPTCPLSSQSFCSYISHCSIPEDYFQKEIILYSYQTFWWVTSATVFLNFYVHEINSRVLKILGWIDSKELIPPAYVAPDGPVRQPYSYSRFLAPIDCSKIPAPQNGANVFCFLSSLPLLSQLSRQCFGLILSSLYP